jgi:hypothetical protein
MFGVASYLELHDVVSVDYISRGLPADVKYWLFEHDSSTLTTFTC